MRENGWTRLEEGLGRVETDTDVDRPYGEREGGGRAEIELGAMWMTEKQGRGSLTVIAIVL